MSEVIIRQDCFNGQWRIDTDTIPILDYSKISSKLFEALEQDFDNIDDAIKIILEVDKCLQLKSKKLREFIN